VAQTESYCGLLAHPTFFDELAIRAEAGSNRVVTFYPSLRGWSGYWTIAIIPIALRVSATGIAITIAHIIPVTAFPFRWTADVVCVIGTIIVIVAAPLGIAPKVTIAVVVL